MSEKSSEYFKRTCLICGCHTDQTINIYEPRSGPNIVELIQAKFKIQPLSEEKYLCFSCNNWLINWHSLQALNSNDGESPSGTSRPQMNGMLYKEKSKNQRQQKQSEFCKQTNSHCRPIAKVRPWYAKTNAHTTTSAKHLHPKLFKEHTLFFDRRKRISKIQFQYCNPIFYYDKRRVILRNILLRRRSIKYKAVNGYIFIPSIQRRNQRAIKSLNILPILTKKVKKKIPNLDQIKYSDDKHTRKPKHEQGILQKNIFNVHTQTIKGNNNIIKFDEHLKKINVNTQFLKTPLVDGKVVSMLRRLGTTLSHNNCNEKTITPQIMSPAKFKPQWARPLDEDEILLNFNSAITEVLPQVVGKQKQKLQDDEQCEPEIIDAIPTKRKLSYQVSIGKHSSQYVYPTLPEGLSITLI